MQTMAVVWWSVLDLCDCRTVETETGHAGQSFRLACPLGKNPGV